MMEAGAEAAVAVLAGLAARERDGIGQRVGVSMRVAAMMSAFSSPYYPGTKEAKPQRTSARRPVVGIRAPQFYACRDGFVQVNISTGGFGALAPDDRVGRHPRAPRPPPTWSTPTGRASPTATTRTPRAGCSRRSTR